jgi:hypothetical protein
MATGIDADQAIALVSKTSGNFVAEMLRLAYAPVQRRSQRARKKQALFGRSCGLASIDISVLPSLSAALRIARRS